jgi:uncharacterized cupredoxin-like copper-binding protein
MTGRFGTVLGVAAVFLLVLAGAFAFTACSDDDDDGTAATATEAVDDSGSDTTATADDDHMDDDDHADEDAVELTIVSSDTFSYDPAELTVAAGERVHLTLNNSSAALVHDWTIDEIEAEDVHSEGAEHGHDDDMDMDEHMMHVAANSGETGTLEFTPLEPGEYVFYCTVEGHRDAGMEGTLIVE